MTEADRRDMGGDRLFAPLAPDYAAARPSYPPAIFDILRARLEAAPPREGQGAPVVADVAAGTGMAARGLLEAGLRAVALEPATGMLVETLKSLQGRPGWTGAVAALAESLPLRASCIDGIVVAQAFHWLDPRPSLDEFARVLRAGGPLLLLWNVTEPDSFTREVWALVERHNPGKKRPVTPEMRDPPRPLLEHPAFAFEGTSLVDHARVLALEEYVRYARSWSYVGGSLGPPQLHAFERELRGVLERHARRGSVVERFVTAAHFARRV